ncbi:DUF1997 domain containing protein [Nitzschia inconspicua]|uniref:DUF1997 domain containing protein n=1 Tax=Nitzschia inconspicua TaxID=303405 RepID=A0A9K3KVK2_9STRA|nr:DUF1997 domain containing protein [Nitzschia inconspicua]
MILGMMKIVSILFLLQLFGFPLFVAAFAATIDRIHTSESSSPTRLSGTLSWSGDANASIDLEEEAISNERGLSIRDWLDDPNASNRALLGSDDVEERPNGAMLCRQPTVDFFGMALRPVFLNKISRTKSGSATVTILDAQTEVDGAGGGRTSNIAGNALRNIMQDSKFQGRSIIQTHGENDNKLSVDLSLTLNVALPPFLLLPPGFNSMGSAIIRRTGQSRCKKLLRDLQRDYQDWVQRHTTVDSAKTTTSLSKSKQTQL